MLTQSCSHQKPQKHDHKSLIRQFVIANFNKLTDNKTKYISSIIHFILVCFSHSNRF